MSHLGKGSKMLVGIYDNNHVYYSSNKSHSKAPKTIVAPCVVIYS